jgi:hypothetical protein
MANVIKLVLQRGEKFKEKRACFLAFTHRTQSPLVIYHWFYDKA